MAIVSAFFSLMLAQKFFINSPAYPDFIVGAITWNAATKFQDLVSYPVFVLGFLTGGCSVYLMLQRTLDNYTYEYGQSLLTTLIWWLVPVAIGIGGLLSIYPNDFSFDIYIGIAGAVITLFAVYLYSHSKKGEVIPQQIGIGVMAIIYWVF